MSKEKTISDYIEKQNKDLPFEARSRKFEEIIMTASKEWGVVPWAQLAYSNEGVIPVPCMKDLWESSTDSNETEK